MPKPSVRRLSQVLSAPAIAAIAALLLLAGCGAPSSSGPTATPTSIASSPSSRSATGPYPTPQEETFQGCPPQGDGGDTQLNVLKNRIDSAAWQSTALQSLLGLTWPQGVEKTRRSTWSTSDAQAIAQNEGRPVQAEGYVLMIRHEGPESPNCHDAAQRDYHVWLAVSASEPRADAMVVELTPRVVALNPNWGTATQILRLAGHHVRVSGWLMMDQEHPEQLHKTRGTLWEIHPVMQIEVDQNGAWANLASGGVTLGPASSRPSGSQSGQSGSSSSSHHRTSHRHHTHRHR